MLLERGRYFALGLSIYGLPPQLTSFAPCNADALTLLTTLKIVRWRPLRPLLSPASYNFF
jgi:hypothetical protein